MFVADVSIGFDGYTCARFKELLTTEDAMKSQLRQLQLVSALCNGSNFDSETKNLDISKRVVFGDATDSAILRFSKGLEPSVHTADSIRHDTDKIFEIPFNSKNKWMMNI